MDDIQTVWDISIQKPVIAQILILGVLNFQLAVMSLHIFKAVPILADEPGLRLLSLQHNLIKRIQNLDSIFRLVSTGLPNAYKGNKNIYAIVP